MKSITLEQFKDLILEESDVMYLLASSEYTGLMRDVIDHYHRAQQYRIEKSDFPFKEVLKKNDNEAYELLKKQLSTISDEDLAKRYYEGSYAAVDRIETVLSFELTLAYPPEKHGDIAKSMFEPLGLISDKYLPLMGLLFCASMNFEGRENVKELYEEMKDEQFEYLVAQLEGLKEKLLVSKAS